MADTPAIAIRDLAAGYGGKPVLQGVDMTIGRGEVVAVIGRNGVGKTTLMRALIGLLAASSGEIRFDGNPINAFGAHQRARRGIGYVPQGRDVFPRMSVEDNLRVGVRPGAADIERAYEVFPILRERKRQAAGTLSGGQQQQLAIGRVLVAQPRLILLDEPSEGIQPSIVQEIARVITALNRSAGTTILLVEQNIDTIRAMAQRCYVMDKGRIVAELAPADLDNRETVRRYLAI
jgi:urea ABC transporter ATP-binding protein UrtE